MSWGEPSRGYDLRAGAAAYAPIIGGIGGLVVPAVVLVFQIAAHHPIKGGNEENLLGVTTALLVVGLISCLLGAFAFAAIGAERRTTPSLVAAIIYAGAGTAIGAVAIIEAFEALATLYIHEAQSLFAYITFGAAAAGVALISLVLGDAWCAIPEGNWLARRSEGNRWTCLMVALGCAPIAISGVLRLAGVGFSPRGPGLHVIVGVGIFLAVLLPLGSMFRTMTGDDGAEWLPTKAEVVPAICCLGLYLAILLAMMPR